MTRCEVCGQWPADRAHLVARSVLPKKDEWNPRYWIYLCRKHHTEQHTVGIISFCAKYRMLDKLRHAGYPEWRITEWLMSRVPKTK